MKILLIICLALISYSQNEITLISDLNQYEKIEEDEFILSWEIPVNSERNHHSGYWNSNDEDYKGVSELISNQNHTILSVVFNKDDGSISSWSASGYNAVRFKRHLPMHWAGLVTVNQSYTFIKSLLQKDYEKNKLYGLLVAHEKDKETLKYLQSEFGDENRNRLREKIVFWIGTIESDEAAEYLIKLFAKDSHQKLKEKVIFALHINKTDKAYAFLKSIVNSDQYSIHIREKALFWYGQSKQTLLSDLVDLMENLDSRELREKCIFAISQKNTKEATDYLYKMVLSNQPQNIREKALFWYGQSKASSLSDLYELMNKLNSRELKEKCIFAISQKNSKESAEFLFKLAQSDEALNLREKAIFWLGNNNNHSMDYLKKLFVASNERKIQEKLIFAFHQNGSDEAVDFMVKLLNSDITDTRVKKKIIFWLGQSRSKAAQNAISKILD